MAENEIRHLQALRGEPRIVGLKQVIQTNNTVYLITELCEKGSLHDLIKREGRLPEEQAVSILRQIVEAGEAMFRNGIVHMDLKTTNILINTDDEVRVCDFGMAATERECEQSLEQNIGSPLFMAPETLINNEYSHKSVIWAIGVVFIEMLTGKLPWKAKTER